MEEHVTIPHSMEQAGQTAVGFFESFKQTIKDAVQFIIDKVKDYKGSLVEIGVYTGIGFVVGYLLKKYLKYILLLLLFIVALVILEQFDLVHTSVNTQKIQELLNLQPSTSFDNQAFSSYLEWVKTNFVIVLSASIGFLIGLKLG